MNIRLQYDIEFQAGVWFDEQYKINSYSVSMQMVTKVSDQNWLNVAMERLRTFVYEELGNGVFINRENEEQAELLQFAGLNVITLPNEPVDQIIGMMLFCKLNAIMEGVIHVVNLDISSTLGDSVWYSHDEDDNLGPFADQGWWHQLSTQKDTLPDDDEAENVVKVQTTGWHEYGLEWPNADETEHNATILKFNRNES